METDLRGAFGAPPFEILLSRLHLIQAAVRWCGPRASLPVRLLQQSPQLPGSPARMLLPRSYRSIHLLKPTGGPPYFAHGKIITGAIMAKMRDGQDASGTSFSPGWAFRNRGARNPGAGSRIGPDQGPGLRDLP